jgi:hypothetical protein
MRSVECQVAAAVAARSMGVEASGPLHLAAFAPVRLADSGQQAQPDLVLLPAADSDQAPASVHLAQCSGLAGSQALVHQIAHSVREAFRPAGTYSSTVLL